MEVLDSIGLTSTIAPLSLKYFILRPSRGPILIYIKQLLLPRFTVQVHCLVDFLASLTYKQTLVAPVHISKVALPL